MSRRRPPPELALVTTRTPPGGPSGAFGEDLAHCVGGTPRRGDVLVSVALKGERRRGVSGEGL
jgi:hypothetical protein